MPPTLCKGESESTKFVRLITIAAPIGMRRTGAISLPSL